MMTAPLVSRADVRTDNPGRYAKQLVSHLGHRLEFATEGPVSRATVGEGAAEIVVGANVLTLVATAPDLTSLGRVQDVLGRHLERFGQRNELVVTWSDVADPRRGQ